MYIIIDFLFAKKFGAEEITWTGESKRGPKIALSKLVNLIDLMIQSVLAIDTAASIKQCSDFLHKNILKNSGRRANTLGMRMTKQREGVKRSRLIDYSMEDEDDVDNVDRTEENIEDTPKTNTEQNSVNSSSVPGIPERNEVVEEFGNENSEKLSISQEI